jgi:ubiquinone/menaquinone biosynthesis C-methylase UbiE
MKKRKRNRDARGKPENVVHDNMNNAFYDASETLRYTKAERASGIQDEISLRALHMLQCHLNSDKGNLILDIGIGAGACANIVQKKIPTSFVVGLDISLDMLQMGLTNTSKKFCRDSLAYNFCDGLPFRNNSQFDAIISISALQWLCCKINKDPPIDRFMNAIDKLLAPNGIFISQFYPTCVSDCGRLLKAAREYGNSQVFMDMPHKNKSKRYFLSIRRRRLENKKHNDEMTSVRSVSNFCPCAFPYEGTCSLCIHKTLNTSWYDKMPGSKKEDKEEWEKRIAKVHVVYSKKIQQTLQSLWKKQDGTNLKKRRIVHNNNNLSSTTTNLSWEKVYSRRARIEAFLCGTKEKAKEKHLLSYYQDNPLLDNLIHDTEEEIKYISTLPCFHHCDLFLLRGKKKKKKKKKKMSCVVGNL